MSHRGPLGNTEQGAAVFFGVPGRVPGVADFLHTTPQGHGHGDAPVDLARLLEFNHPHTALGVLGAGRGEMRS